MKGNQRKYWLSIYDSIYNTNILILIINPNQKNKSLKSIKFQTEIPVNFFLKKDIYNPKGSKSNSH